MPPLPPTTQTLTTRLTALSESNKGVQQLIQRLAKLDFQPGSQPLDAEEGDIRLELSAEIHESLKGVEEDLELLRQEVEDFLGAGSSGRRRDSVRDGERSRLAVLLARLTEDLRSSRTQYRKAQLTAKHNADRAKLKERELLFSNLQSGAGSSTPSSTHRRRGNGINESEIVTQASSDVTAALRRTHQLMQSELSRSRFAQETLEQSTAALADLGEKYSDLNSLLANSKTLVTTLLKSQKSDTWYLETTFYILITTVIWLVFRRWLYGPISWFILWPLKLLFRIVFAVIPASAATSSAIANPSTSLIVKPSATGGIPPRHPGQQQANYVRVGGGGRGYAGDPPDPSPPSSLSQSIGNMAEHSQSQSQQGAEDVPDHPQLRKHNPTQQQEDDGPVVRGDGTVLPARGEGAPRNTKKKMWEESVEKARFEAQQAEAEREILGSQKEAEGEAGGQRRKRDEL
ncbi:Sec20-domain-containing protein [Karstenula rhodostoma CBS 690.94]|uniref:Sec20-domain-containing protein n=1 Tax=Karstenula rhodostoma CBS 690.94 TaxID=1392251 RepID=A0A9P4P6G2_9PLEO|nr:Sec20-domain-containing protein [Karstenula rhodostoma CBS 690.94]